MYAYNKDLDNLIRNYFSIDTLGVTTNQSVNIQDKRAKEILESTSRRIGSAWETGLLWKSDSENLPNSKETALNRLIKFQSKLDKEPPYSDLYYKEIDRKIINYAEKVKNKVETKRIWYIPHFGVTDPNKPLKKIRIVFDTADRSKSLSLNDQSLKGPDFLKPLLGILMRFRQYPIAIKGGIKDMFLKVQLREEGRNTQRFLWRVRGRHRPTDEFVMKSLIFGSISSPCSAIYIKEVNAKEFQHTNPEAVTAIMNNSYMDDFLNGCKSEKAAIKI